MRLFGHRVARRMLYTADPITAAQALATADVATRATAINDIAGKIPSLFPEGTGMDKVKDRF